MGKASGKDVKALSDDPAKLAEQLGPYGWAVVSQQVLLNDMGCSIDILEANKLFKLTSVEYFFQMSQHRSIWQE
jgi:hypothetical protein